MDMLDALYEILKGDKRHAMIMADWIEDNFPYHPELDRHVKYLRNPNTLTLHIVISTITKFGCKRERCECMRLVRLALQDKDRYLGRKLLRAWMRKRFSLNVRWYMTDKLKELLGSGTKDPTTDKA